MDTPEDVYFTIDGNKVCATRGDFVNLMVSPAGFGDTEEEALADLVEQEKN